MGPPESYCDFLGKGIGIRSDVAPAQAVKALIHEFGHALLHAQAPVVSREPAEVEIESVAFIVCDAVGLETSDYSFPYLGRWSNGEAGAIRGTAGRVIGCAMEILGELIGGLPPCPLRMLCLALRRRRQGVVRSLRIDG